VPLCRAYVLQEELKALQAAEDTPVMVGRREHLRFIEESFKAVADTIQSKEQFASLFPRKLFSGGCHNRAVGCVLSFCFYHVAVSQQWSVYSSNC